MTMQMYSARGESLVDRNLFGRVLLLLKNTGSRDDARILTSDLSTGGRERVQGIG